MTAAAAAVTVLFTMHLFFGVQCLDIDLLNKQATYIDAKVGSYAVFNCPLDFPQDIEIPYILHWNKEVSEQHLLTQCKRLCVVSKQGQTNLIRRI